MKISSDLSQFAKRKDPLSGGVCLDQKYRIKSPVANFGQYAMFQGVDIEKLQWVNIYAKKVDTNVRLSAPLKQAVRNQLCPKVLWSGVVQNPKFHSYFEVHQKFGPSLRTMFETVKKVPKEKELLHLLFQMIKLIQKMSNSKIVCGQLDTDLIVFDPTPSKNELYLLNSFKLKKKNQCVRPLKSKFCSRGAHLGRCLSVKDDLESICYILIDLFLQGKFLQDKTIQQYEEVKLSEKIQEFAGGLPKPLIDFYFYVISLNLNDEINFFYWKTLLTKILSTFTQCRTSGKDTEEGQILKQKNINAGKTNDCKQIEEEIDKEKESIFDKVRKYKLCGNSKKIDCSNL